MAEGTSTGPPARDERASLLWALAAIFLWGTLAAVVGDALAGVPPTSLLLAVLLFATPVLVVGDLARGRSPRAVFAAPPRVVLLGLWGIFGYHYLLFRALGSAPIVEANLLNYLWPLFMVLLAPLLARERVRPSTLGGALVGFLGAGLVVTQGRALAVSPEHTTGYALAAGAAFVWASFSVLLRRLGPDGEDRMPLFSAVSLGAVAVLAAATGGLALPTGRALVAAAWLGVGPMGVAFFCWSRALSKGSASRIGALSYLTPLLSTLAVSALLGKPLTRASWLGMALIVGGSAVPALLALRRSPPS